jgi:cell division protein FtsL
MSADDTQGTHVKVTINDLYKEQQETNKLLIQLASELKGLSDLPVRVRDIELAQARLSWIEKIAYTALTAGVIALITTIFSNVGA